MPSLADDPQFRATMPSTAAAMKVAESTPIALFLMTLGSFAVVVVSAVLHLFGVMPVIGLPVLIFFLIMTVINNTARGLIEHAVLVNNAVTQETIARVATLKTLSAARLQTPTHS